MSSGSDNSQNKLNKSSKANVKSETNKKAYENANDNIDHDDESEKELDDHKYQQLNKKSDSSNSSILSKQSQECIITSSKGNKSESNSDTDMYNDSKNSKMKNFKPNELVQMTENTYEDLVFDIENKLSFLDDKIEFFKKAKKKNSEKGNMRMAKIDSEIEALTKIIEKKKELQKRIKEKVEGFHNELIADMQEVKNDQDKLLKELSNIKK